MSVPDIGKFTLAESRNLNAAQNAGILFKRPWFQVCLGVKFIGLCNTLNFMEQFCMKIKSFGLYPLCLSASDGGAVLLKSMSAHILLLRVHAVLSISLTLLNVVVSC